MGLLDFIQRRKAKRKKKRIWAKRDKMSRIEYLLDIKHDMLEGGREYHDGLNFLELVEKQLEEGKIDLAVSNIMSQPKDCFELAILYWGQGDLENAEKYLRKTLERYDRFVAVGREHNLPLETYVHSGYTAIKTAAHLLDVKLEGPILKPAINPGYSPSFGEYLLDCCLGSHDFDMGAWQSLEDAWLKDRSPKYMLEEQRLYVKALTGEFANDAEMLKTHEKMWLSIEKRNDASLIEGYGEDNGLFIDAIFAAVLKRIGWEGTYRHSWPNTSSVGTAPQTTHPANCHLGIIAAPPPAPDSISGIIEDRAEARRFIDMHVKDQRDWWEKEHFDATRPAKQRSKVAGALKKLGWKADKATLDLMRDYHMNKILNDSTHIFLSDPVRNLWTGMKRWTDLFVDEFGLHPDFIPVTESEEKSDYRDPQDAWYVYWKMDKRIYMVQRDDWNNPEIATKDARLGLTVWPSYLSFVAWWVAQHLQSEG